MRELLAIVATIVALLVLIVWLHKRSERRLLALIRDSSEDADPSRDPAIDAAGRAPSGAAPPHPLPFELFVANEMPPPSDRAVAFLDRADRLYRRGIWISIRSMLLLGTGCGAIAWLSGPVSKGLVGLAALVTVGNLVPFRPTKVRGFDAIMGHGLFSCLWYGLAIGMALAHGGTLGTAAWLLVGLAILVEWLSRVALAREVRSSTCSLLFLWVFGSGERPTRVRDDLFVLWRRLGDVCLLRGPGYLADTMTLLVRRFRGALIGSPSELVGATASWDREPRRSVYSHRTLLCTDRVWRQGIDELLSRCDVVLMDLTGFSEENQGCAYELGLLIDRIPLQRSVVMVDEATDLDDLLELLRDCWQDMAADSPNRDPAAGALHILRFERVDAGQFTSIWTDPKGSEHDLARAKAKRIECDPIFELLARAATSPPLRHRAGSADVGASPG